MDLADRAAHFAAEAERDRRLPAQLVTEMADAGVFRMCVPRAAGGLEEHPTVLGETVEALARGDGAAGWCAAINATSGLLVGYVPEEAAREVYAEPRTVAGGVFAPLGRAKPVDGGFTVTGRWPFASGCTHCDWLMGGCLVEGEDPPAPRLMLAHADEVQIHDTWDSIGLRGTGSHDIEMSDVFVPAERSASIGVERPVAQGRLYGFPVFGLLALAIGAVGLGIARGALDDVVALAGRRTPTGSRRTMGERASVQAEVAAAEARLRAARSFLLSAIDEAWAAASEGGQVPVEQRTGLRLAATHAATTGADVTRAGYRLRRGRSVPQARRPRPR